MVTAKQFVEKVYIPLLELWGYIYGTWGSIWTEARQKADTRPQTIEYGSRWIGHMVTDCSGLLRWALKQLGVDIVHHARYQYTDQCKNKGRLVNGAREDGKPVLPGTAVFLQGSQEHIHHVGAYVGHGRCIEAKGTRWGVVVSELSHWDHWGELKMVDYTDAEQIENEDAPEIPDRVAEPPAIGRAMVTNPKTWLNVRSGPGTKYSVVFRVEKGDIVDVIDNSMESWWKIRYGGRIGWASADYLTPLVDEDPDDEPDDDNEEKPNQDSLLLGTLQDTIETMQANLNAIRDLVKQLL